MLVFLQNFVHRIRGERWTDTNLSSGIEFRLVFNRSGDVKAIILRHLPTYKKSTFSDTRGSIRIDVTSGEWKQLVEYSRSKGEALQSPIDFYFDRERDRIFYSLDGATFSVQCVSIAEIDAQLCQLP